MQWRPARFPVPAVFHAQRQLPVFPEESWFVTAASSLLPNHSLGISGILAFSAWERAGRTQDWGNHHSKIFELGAPPRSPGLG